MEKQEKSSVMDEINLYADLGNELFSLEKAVLEACRLFRDTPFESFNPDKKFNTSEVLIRCTELMLTAKHSVELVSEALREATNE